MFYRLRVRMVWRLGGHKGKMCQWVERREKVHTEKDEVIREVLFT